MGRGGCRNRSQAGPREEPDQNLAVGAAAITVIRLLLSGRRGLEVVQRLRELQRESPLDRRGQRGGVGTPPALARPGD